MRGGHSQVSRSVFPPAQLSGSALARTATGGVARGDERPPIYPPRGAGFEDGALVRSSALRRTVSSRARGASERPRLGGTSAYTRHLATRIQPVTSGTCSSTWSLARAASCPPCSSARRLSWSTPCRSHVSQARTSRTCPPLPGFARLSLGSPRWYVDDLGLAEPELPSLRSLSSSNADTASRPLATSSPTIAAGFLPAASRRLSRGRRVQ